MTRRSILYIAIAFLVLASGCAPCHRLLLSDPSLCAVPAGPAWGPSRAGCGPECEPGVGPGCGAVYGPCHPCFGRGLLGWLFALFRPHGAWCDGGCGMRYWGGFLSDPPDYCEPCDRSGNWVGSAGAAGIGPMGAGRVGPAAPAGAVAVPGACPDCLLPSAQTASRPVPSRGFQPAPAGPMAVQLAQPWQAAQEPGIVTDTASPFAPRLISVTDRVVVPAVPEPARQMPAGSGKAPPARLAESPQPAERTVR